MGLAERVASVVQEGPVALVASAVQAVREDPVEQAASAEAQADLEVQPLVQAPVQTHNPAVAPAVVRAVQALEVAVCHPDRAPAGAPLAAAATVGIPHEPAAPGEAAA